jgi:Zn-dependent protease
MRNVTVARVWGIPIRINVSLVVFAPILVWLIGSGDQIAGYAAVVADATGTPLDGAALSAGLLPWLLGSAAAVGLFVSVTLHELGHSWVAMRYDIEIESITLWIFGGIASLSSVPREWQREFWIAVAGPVASVGVAVVCLAVASLLPASLPAAVFVVGWLGLVNVTLAVFNMLPAFPMDGGRVLRAVLARSRPYADATDIAARIGVFFAFLFAIVGVLNFNPILLLVALFIYGAAKTESRVTAMTDLLDGLDVSDVVDPTDVTVAADTTLADLGTRMLVDRRTSYPVADRDGSIVGAVDLGAMTGLDADAVASTTVRDVMTTDLPRVGVDDDAFEALMALSRSPTQAALVEDADGVVGVVTRADFGRLLDIREHVKLPQ